MFSEQLDGYRLCASKREGATSTMQGPWYIYYLTKTAI